MKKQKIFYIIITAIFILYLIILVGDIRVLVFEKKINPGQQYLIEDFEYLNKSDKPWLVCKYFNGRKILTIPYWYSASNIMGQDSCPFIDRK